MNKSAKHNGQTRLKSLINQSHNSDDRLIALVKFLARRAAEEDYKASCKPPIIRQSKVKNNDE